MKIELTTNKGFFEDLVMKISEAMNKQNDAAISAAKGYSPKDTGKLSNLIDGELKVNDEEIVSTIFSPLPYAMQQEVGGSKGPGKHYLKKGTLASIKALEGAL